MKIKLNTRAFKMPELGPASSGKGGGRGRKPAALVAVDADWKRLVELFLFALQNIRNERVAAGRTVDGRPLLDGQSDRYSPGYAKSKAGKGRAIYTPGDRLTLSGAMLLAQHIEATPTRGILKFSAEEAEKAYKNNLLRPFIEFTAEEIQEAWRNAVIQWRETKK